MFSSPLPDSCGEARPLPPSTIGEILVHGRSVAIGYWNRSEADAPLFVSLTLDPDSPGLPCLRTGDLGFLDAAGHLYVTGRLKDLIILRGQNPPPEDVETALDTRHPSLRPGKLAAFAIDSPDALEEQLVVVAEVERSARAALREADARQRAAAQAAPALDLVIVSGLPRSGTSLMMQMLAAGGLPPSPTPTANPTPTTQKATTSGNPSNASPTIPASSSRPPATS